MRAGATELTFSPASPACSQNHLLFLSEGVHLSRADANQFQILSD